MHRQPSRRPSRPLILPSQSSQSSQPSASSGSPKEIPPDKFDDALVLYRKYKWQIKLAAQPIEGPHTHNDTLLNPNTTLTATSTSSRVFTASSSVSGKEPRTDISSLVSFRGEGCPVPVSEVGDTEWRDSKNQKVKRNKRRCLTPTEKAKANLIRVLGSCPRCKPRKVPCPLEHHDVEALEKAFQSSPQTQQPPAPKAHAGTSGGPSGQSDSLLGIGEHHSQTSTFILDQQADPWQEIEASNTPSLPIDITNGIEDPISLDTNPNYFYQSPLMFRLGVRRRGRFLCKYLLGPCGRTFSSRESLEDHFENSHLEFTRIQPSERYICSGCGWWNMPSTGPCQHCGLGVIEVWIFANYNWSPSFQQHGPAGDDHFTMGSSSSTHLFPPGMGAYQGQFGPGPRSSFDGSNGGMNQGGYNFHNHNNAPQDPGPQGYGYNGFGSPPPNNHAGWNNRSMGARVLARCNLLNDPSGFTRVLQKYRRYKPVVDMACFLVTVETIIGTDGWLKVHELQISWSILLICFVGMLASFMMANLYWFVGHMGVHGDRRTACGACRCPFHHLPGFHLGAPFGLECRRSKPAMRARGAEAGRYPSLPAAPVKEQVNSRFTVCG